MRTVQGWTQKELAEASGVPGSLLSDYERGRKTLSRGRLEVLVSTMGLSGDAIDQALAFIRLIHVSSPSAGIPGDDQRRRIEIVASEFGARSADFARWALTRLTTAARAEEERLEAQGLWARLKQKKPAERRRIVEASERFRSWALCELVCKESVDAARDSADRALELATLALRMAELTPGEEAWRSRIQGFAWAHLGNARRVKGDLPGADEAFHRVARLWGRGEGQLPNLLDEALVLGLEASLRRAQRRLDETLELLDRALAMDRGHLTPHLLLNKAKTFEELHDFERAIGVLRQAAPFVEKEGKPRLIVALRFNLAVNLCLLGRYKDAADCLPELRDIVRRIHDELDLVRLRWLEGKVAAGSGDRETAIVKLQQVREDFTAREMGYDVALVSLELAVLYLEQDCTREVRNLARQILWIFHTQGVHREALAVLQLFCQAAEKEEITLHLARRILKYLFFAKDDPELRFEDFA